MIFDDNALSNHDSILTMKQRTARETTIPSAFASASSRSAATAAVAKGARRGARRSVAADGDPKRGRAAVRSGPKRREVVARGAGESRSAEIAGSETSIRSELFAMLDLERGGESVDDTDVNEGKSRQKLASVTDP